ncbi:hypothetical protein LCGC14_2393780 [marine sediment metagenome]|uniref:Uncharacterized protein n=1 Tax=marine sediment metagenome TaxID=412755 RepID=A0A0F9ERV2_9ZZZZ
MVRVIMRTKAKSKTIIVPRRVFIKIPRGLHALTCSRSPAWITVQGITTAVRSSGPARPNTAPLMIDTGAPASMSAWILSSVTRSRHLRRPGRSGRGALSSDSDLRRIDQPERHAQFRRDVDFRPDASALLPAVQREDGEFPACRHVDAVVTLPERPIARHAVPHQRMRVDDGAEAGAISERAMRRFLACIVLEVSVPR